MHSYCLLPGILSFRFIQLHFSKPFFNIAYLDVCRKWWINLCLMNCVLCFAMISPVRFSGHLISKFLEGFPVDHSFYTWEKGKKSAILGTRQTARRSLLQWCGSLSTGDRSSLKAQYLSWSLAVMHTDKDSIWANPEDSKAVFVPASRSCLYLRRLSLWAANSGTVRLWLEA